MKPNVDVEAALNMETGPRSPAANSGRRGHLGNAYVPMAKFKPSQEVSWQSSAMKQT